MDRKALLVHSSALSYKGKGFVFAGRAHQGKTTIANFFPRYALHDDINVIMDKKDKPVVYGFTFQKGVGRVKSRNCRTVVRNVFFIRKAKKNDFIKLKKEEALVRLLYNLRLPSLLWVETGNVRKKIFNTAAEIVKKIDCYEMRFSRSKAFWSKIKKGL
ncbi:MAG: hypothetical protein ABIE23_05095 [archaeon]